MASNRNWYPLARTKTRHRKLLQRDNGKEPAQRPGEAQPAPLSITHGDSQLRHTYLIVLDTLNSSMASFVQVREALKKLFQQEQGADTQYAVIALGRTTVVIQNLTRDPKAVLAALENKKLNKAIASSEASNLAQQEIDLRRMLEDKCRQAGNPDTIEPKKKNEAPDPCGPVNTDSILIWANNAARERRMLTRNFLSDLRSLTEQLSRTPGRRVLVMASDGFNLQPGRQLFDMIATYTNRPQYALLDQSANLIEEMRAIVTLATARNVTFYTLDSRGLYAPAGFDISEKVQVPDLSMMANVTSTIGTSDVENQDPMNYLAQATGGVFYHNSNDLSKGLHQSFSDGRSYYEFAYESTNPSTDGKYRAIKVQVKGKSLLVRAKSGYWALAMEPATVASTPVVATSALTEPLTTPIVLTASPTPPTRRTISPPASALVDIPTAKLARKVPELKNLKPAASQDSLGSILQKVGANVATFFNNFPSVTSREQVVEQRLEADQSAEVQTYHDKIYHDFRYLAVANPDRKQVNLKEYRTDANGHGIDPKGLDDGYMITQGFVSTPVFFDPAHQLESRFRFLGQQVVDGRNAYVVAFAQLPSAQVKERIALGNGHSVEVLTQGLAWIDPDNYQIIRMWTDLTAPVPEIKLQAQTTQVNFAEVHFSDMASGLWLPNKVDVEMKFSAVIFRNSHTYSDFKLFSVDTEERQAAPASP